MIPKKIHWCWLSGDPLPAQIRDCIASWKRLMPDYEIICWDKDRFDIHSVPFVDQAYACRKYAFAADYIRLYALYTEGGIYLDSDVMVFERFDKFLNHSAFSSVEYIPAMIPWRNENNKYMGYAINGAMIASEKGNLWIKQSLEHYKDKKFQMKDGKIIGVDIIVDVLSHYAHDGWNFKYDDHSGKPQYLKDNIVIYPPFVFASMWGQVDWRTCALHLGEQAWIDSVQQQRKQEGVLRKKYRILCSHWRFFAWLHYWRRKIINR